MVPEEMERNRVKEEVPVSSAQFSAGPATFRVMYSTLGIIYWKDSDRIGQG